MASNHVLDKDRIVEFLLESSPAFNHFYESENIEAISTAWFQDSSMQEDAHTSPPLRGIYPILFKRRPERPEDAYLVAHELLHIVRSVRNFSLKIVENNSIFPTNITQIAAFTLRNLIEDPIIDGILLEAYSFDFLNHYESGIEKMKHSLIENHYRDSMNDDFARFQVLLNLSKQKLKWHPIEDRETNQTWTEYEEWLMSEYPMTISYRNSLVPWLEERLNTREGQAEIFSKITETFGLTSMVYLQ